MKKQNKKSPAKQVSKKTTMITEDVAKVLSENFQFSCTAQEIYSIEEERLHRLKGYRDRDYINLENKFFELKKLVDQSSDYYEDDCFLLRFDEFLAPISDNVKELEDIHGRVWEYDREIYYAQYAIDKLQPHRPKVKPPTPLGSSK